MAIERLRDTLDLGNGMSPHPPDTGDYIRTTLARTVVEEISRAAHWIVTATHGGGNDFPPLQNNVYYQVSDAGMLIVRKSKGLLKADVYRPSQVDGEVIDAFEDEISIRGLDELGSDFQGLRLVRKAARVNGSQGVQLKTREITSIFAAPNGARNIALRHYVEPPLREFALLSAQAPSDTVQTLDLMPARQVVFARDMDVIKPDIAQHMADTVMAAITGVCQQRLRTEQDVPVSSEVMRSNTDPHMPRQGWLARTLHSWPKLV